MTKPSFLASLMMSAVIGLSLPLAARAETPVAPKVERVVEGNLVMEGIPEIPQDVRDTLIRYQNVRGHAFRAWAGDSILIGTRFGEVSQVHKVDMPMGAREQLTFFDEPSSGALVSPEGDAFLFSRDKGGDEFYQAFRYDLKTGDITQFTEDGTRNGGMVWADDGGFAIWYRAQDGNPNYDILMGDPADPSGNKVIHEGKGALFPSDISKDGKTVLLQQYISIAKSRLFLLDIESGDLNEIKPDEDMAYSGGIILDDGMILSVSDKGSEFRQFMLIDPKTGEDEALVEGVKWDVSSYDLSPDGKTLAYTLNEGGLGTIYLMDLATKKISPVEGLPVGIAAGVEWNEAGTRLGFTFNSATSPSDAWSLDVASGELTRWTRAEIGGMSSAGFAEPELITFKNADGMDIPAWVYKPAGEGPHPTIISIHGGPEGQSRPYFSSTYQYWVKELGLAVVVPNVRGSSGYGKTYLSLDNGLNRKKSVEDIGALLDWMDKDTSFDMDKVVVYGGSYGGYMVLASMVDYNDRLAGGIDIVGISDFKTFLENTKGYRRDLRRAEYGDERDPEIAAFFEKISPLKNADKITKPLFIIQGANDPRVPASEAEQILAAVRKNGGNAWFLLANDEGHGFRKKSNRDFQREAETLFLKDVLGFDN